MSRPRFPFHPASLLFQSDWARLTRPSLFFLLAIYYEELFLKLYCFHSLSLSGAVFTLLFTIPVALLMGLLRPWRRICIRLWPYFSWLWVA